MCGLLKDKKNTRIQLLIKARSLLGGAVLFFIALEEMPLVPTVTHVHYLKTMGFFTCRASGHDLAEMALRAKWGGLVGLTRFPTLSTKGFIAALYR